MENMTLAFGLLLLTVMIGWMVYLLEQARAAEAAAKAAEIARDKAEHELRQLRHDAALEARRAASRQSVAVTACQVEIEGLKREVLSLRTVLGDRINEAREAQK